MTPDLLAPARILLVDDDPALRSFLSLLLKGWGYIPIAVEGAEEAYQALRDVRFDLVVLDVNMPGIDGFEALATMRTHYDKASLPVIMVTGREEHEDVVRAFAEGANDYIVKPPDLAQYRRRLDNQLVLKRPRDKTIGPYNLLMRLGQGARGTIYRARHQKTDEEVALKVLQRAFTFDPENVARFEREASLLAKVDHPNVVRSYGTGVDGEVHYLVMELIDGRSLHGRRFSPKEALELGLQVTEGLVALHAMGIVHRDIKPENLLRDHSGTVKITDLGVAREADSSGLTQVGGLVGTVLYAAPEQLDGDVEPRSDLYALGCTLYELIAGDPPFPHDTKLSQLVMAKMRAPPRLLDAEPTAPAAVDALLARLMAPRPDDRFASAREAANGIKAVLDTLDG